MIICFSASNYAGADEVVLLEGDVIRGKITEQSDLGIVLDHNDLGRIEIRKERIKSVTIGPPKTDESGEPAKEVETTKKDDQVGPPFKWLNSWTSELKKKGWGASFDLSLNSSSGNTDERSFRLGANAKRQQLDRRLMADFAYYNAETEDSVTDNKASLGITRDWLRPESPWFFFADIRYDYDEFESWEHRLAGHIGPAYHLFDSDKLKLDLRLGTGTRKEWGSDNDDMGVEGLGRVDIDWKIAARQSLNVTSSIYPVYSDLNDFRTRNSVNWRLMISEDMNLSLLIGLLHEYQSKVDPGKEKSDLRIHSGIQYKF